MKLIPGDLPVPQLHRALRNQEHGNKRRAGRRPVKILCPYCGGVIAVWGVLDVGHGLDDDAPEGHPVDEKRCRDRWPPTARPNGMDIPMSTQLVCRCGFERPRGNDKISQAVVSAEAAGQKSVTVDVDF